jgi:phosphatidylinositol 4-kinase type 2
MCFAEEQGNLEAQNEASNSTQDPSPRFQWTEALQQNFREELEKLVILDYMMRNTGINPCSGVDVDRGSDNWMIKICWHNHDEDDTTHLDSKLHTPQPDLKDSHPVTEQPSPALVDVRISEGSTTGSGDATSTSRTPHIHIGAIDNSLAFPWKHPDEWRSFPLSPPVGPFLP